MLHIRTQAVLPFSIEYTSSTEDHISTEAVLHISTDLVRHIAGGLVSMLPENAHDLASGQLTAHVTGC